MYDPVLRLRAGLDYGRIDTDMVQNCRILIHHDPDIEAGRHTMRQQDYSTEEYEIRRKWNWDFDRLVPFQSPRSVRLADLPYDSEDLGDLIRLKVKIDGFGYRSDHQRGSIERLSIPLVSNDVSSMYMSVLKAYPGLPILRKEAFPPSRFPNARAIDICVTTSGLTEGLGRTVEDYPMVEAPKPGAHKPTGRRWASVEAAAMHDEGWHRVAIWPFER